MKTEFISHLAITDAKTEQLEENLEQLKEVKDVDQMQLSDALECFFRFKEAYDRLNAVRLKYYHILDEMNKKQIPDMLRDSGLERVQVPSVERSFGVLIKHSASIKDRDAGYEWLKAQGADSLITETVNASALSAYLKDLMLNEGIEPPADAIKFDSYNVTGINKYTPKT